MYFHDYSDSAVYAYSTCISRDDSSHKALPYCETLTGVYRLLITQQTIAIGHITSTTFVYVLDCDMFVVIVGQYCSV